MFASESGDLRAGARPRAGSGGDDGAASGFTCPECRGALWEEREAPVARYQCRVGHVYSQSALVAAQARELEMALWTALTALEEHAALLRALAERMLRHGHARSARQFEDRRCEVEARAARVRGALTLGPLADVGEVAGTAAAPVMR